MSVFINQHSRVIYQGFTGQHVPSHPAQPISHGLNVVGGVTPGKGGATHLDRPVFDTVSDAVQQAGADVSGIFVPPQFAADAILEAVEAGIKTIVVIADGDPERARREAERLQREAAERLQEQREAEREAKRAAALAAWKKANSGIGWAEEIEEDQGE